MTAGARTHTAGRTRQDMQKAAEELQGRAHATDRHTEQATGTGRRKGTQQDTHGSHGTHNRQQERMTSGRKAGRRREGRGWPRAWPLAWGVVEEGSEEETRQQGAGNRESRQKKKDMIYI